MAIVYRHRRLDTNEIFYVGIELDTLYKKAEGVRSTRKNGRSKFWNNITLKTDYSVEIIYNNISNDEAIEVEIFLISLYGRKDLKLGSLVNLTNGGEGSPGVITSKESNLKRSISLKGKNSGKNNPMYGKNPYENITHYRSRKIINIETFEIFPTIKSVLKIINIPKTTFLRWLNQPNKNKTKFRYYSE